MAKSCTTRYNTDMDYFANELKSQNTINQSVDELKKRINKHLDDWGGQISWNSNIKSISAKDVSEKVQSAINKLTINPSTAISTITNRAADIIAKAVDFSQYAVAITKISDSSATLIDKEKAQKTVLIGNALRSAIVGIKIENNTNVLKTKITNILTNWDGADFFLGSNLFISKEDLSKYIRDEVQNKFNTNNNATARDILPIIEKIIEKAGFKSKSELEAAYNDPNYKAKAENILEIINVLKLAVLNIEAEQIPGDLKKEINTLITNLGDITIYFQKTTTSKSAAEIKTAVTSAIDTQHTTNNTSKPKEYADKVANSVATEAGFTDYDDAKKKQSSGNIEEIQKAEEVLNIVNYLKLVIFGATPEITTMTSEKLQAEVKSLIKDLGDSKILYQELNNISATDIKNAVETAVDLPNITNASNVQTIAANAALAIAKKVDSSISAYTELEQILSTPKDYSLVQVEKAQQVQNIAQGVKMGILSLASETGGSGSDLKTKFDTYLDSIGGTQGGSQKKIIVYTDAANNNGVAIDIQTLKDTYKDINSNKPADYATPVYNTIAGKLNKHGPEPFIPTAIGDPESAQTLFTDVIASTIFSAMMIIGNAKPSGDLKLDVTNFLTNWNGDSIFWYEDKVNNITATDLESTVNGCNNCTNKAHADAIANKIAELGSFTNFADVKTKAASTTEKINNVAKAKAFLDFITDIQILLLNADTEINFGNLKDAIKSFTDNWDGIEIKYDTVESKKILASNLNTYIDEQYNKVRSSQPKDYSDKIADSVAIEAGFRDYKDVKAKAALTQGDTNDIAKAKAILEFITDTQRMLLNADTELIRAAIKDAIKPFINSWGGFDIMNMEGTKVTATEIKTAVIDAIDTQNNSSDIAGYANAIASKLEDKTKLSNFAKQAAYQDSSNIYAYAENVLEVINNLNSAISNIDSNTNTGVLKDDVLNFFKKWPAAAITWKDDTTKTFEANEILTAVKSAVENTLPSSITDRLQTLKDVADAAADAIAQKVAFTDYADAIESLSSQDFSTQQKAQQVVSTANALKLAIVGIQPKSVLEDVNIVFDNINKTLLNPITALEFSSSQIAYVGVDEQCATSKQCKVGFVNKEKLFVDKLLITLKQDNYLKVKVTSPDMPGSFPYTLNVDKSSIQVKIVNINCDYVLFVDGKNIYTLLSFNNNIDFSKLTKNGLTFTAVSPLINDINEYSRYASLKRIVPSLKGTINQYAYNDSLELITPQDEIIPSADL
jgi:hypothetical protein